MAVTFTVSATWGTVPLTITVTDTSAPASTSSNWDFGDGTVISGTTATHTYGVVGTYTVTLNTNAGSATETVEVVPEYEVSLNSQTLSILTQQVDFRDFASIGLRGLQSTYPKYWYDNGQFPLRTIAFWPVPSQNFGVELWCWEPITQETDLDAELNLPPGYERYLRYKLAIEIAPEFGMEISPTVLQNYKESEVVVKRLNQQKPVASLSNHAASTGSRGDVPAIDIVGFRGGLNMLPGVR
jgi:PKD repeat protein